uniref:SHSP domain-containing protein n=1 Tax=Oncorhynchus mykiss TaxID=8022 RepID=A0A8K9V357_ONCMY
MTGKFLKTLELQVAAYKSCETSPMLCSRGFQSSLSPLMDFYWPVHKGFALTLDTKDFSPEELSVKQVGRKLKVSGKTEKKLDDGEGSYSYRCQEFRQEFDLPEEVNPETVTCSLAHDGKLHIQAPKNPLSCEDEVAERVVPINYVNI